MIDFALKSQAVTVPAICALLTLWAVAEAWRRPAAAVCGRADRVFVLSALLIPYVLIGGMWRLNTSVMIGTTVVLFALGMAGRFLLQPENQAATALPDWRWSSRVSVGLLGATALVALASPTVWIHYDSLHSAVMPIDLAVNGVSPSTWLSAFAATEWFVLVQGMLPVLSAYEILLTGALTDAFPLLYVLLTLVLVCRSSRQDVVTQAVLLVMGAVFMMDFAMSPRPHVLVGLLAALLYLRSLNRAWSSELLVYLVLLALAKRDGLVLAGLLAVAVASRATFETLGWKGVAGVLLVALPALALGLNSWGAIQSLSPLAALSATLFRPESFVPLVGKPEILISLMAGVVTIAGLAAAGRSRDALVPLVVTAFVVVTGATLEALDRYNLGTVLRKVYYIQFPVLICVALSLLKSGEGGRWRRLAPYGLVVVLLAVFLGDLRPQTVNVSGNKPYADGALQAHRFLLALGREFPGGVVLVTADEPDIPGLDRSAEIALVPAGGVTGHIFPYLTALNGATFRVVSRQSLCVSGLPARSAAILTPEVVGERMLSEAHGAAAAVRLKSGYGVVLPREQVGWLSANFGTELDGVLSRGERFDPAGLVVTSADVKTLERPWGAVPQYLYVSATNRLTFDLQPGTPRDGELTFSLHPLGSYRFESLLLRYSAERPDVHVPPPAPDGDLTVRIALAGLQSIEVVMGESAHEPVFGGYVFLMHDPLVMRRPVVALREAAGSFGFCTQPIG